jgi:hypothetical protein
LKSRVTEDYIARFAELPDDIKDRARRSYRLWRRDPQHPGLQFKRIHGEEPLYSVRIGLHWRALGLLDGDTITWFWIGPHGEYDKLIG